jgi:hypothetical protein
MTSTDVNGAAPGPSEAAVPEGLVSAVVNLVGTGPVLLGAYTIAELTAVDAVVDFLEARPSDEVLTEAVPTTTNQPAGTSGSTVRTTWSKATAASGRSPQGPHPHEPTSRSPRPPKP